MFLSAGLKEHFRELHNSALFFTDMSLLETKAAATREYE